MVCQTLIPVTSIFGTIANQQHSMIHRFPFATFVRWARVDTAAIVHEISPSRRLDSKDPKTHEFCSENPLLGDVISSLFKRLVNFGGYTSMFQNCGCKSLLFVVCLVLYPWKSKAGTWEWSCAKMAYLQFYSPFFQLPCSLYPQCM